MGGGNGAGAVPLSQIYEEVTAIHGQLLRVCHHYSEFIANIICIFSRGALLNKLGTVKTEWTGDKRNLLRNNAGLAWEDKRCRPASRTWPELAMVAPPPPRWAACCDPSHNLRASIHQFGAHDYFSCYSPGRNGNYPGQYLCRSQALQSFMTGACSIIIMVGKGCDFDLMELVKACIGPPM